MKEQQNNSEQQPQLLDQAKFQAIAGAFSRLQQLGDKQISTPGGNTPAEREQLIEYLAQNMMLHISEFLAAWSLCHGEYLPLLNNLRKVAMRAGFFTPPRPENTL